MIEEIVENMKPGTSQFNILIYLAFKGPSPPIEISEEIGIPPGTVRPALRSLLEKDLIVVDTSSFRKWRDSIWPPSNKSETEFFSADLQIAIDISKDLYPQKPSYDLTSKTQYSIEKRRIEGALKQKEYDHLDKSTRASLAKIINPVSKKSFTK